MGLESETGQHFHAVGHLAYRRIEDEFVVLDLRRSRIFGLNPSGGEVLEALQVPLTVGQIAERLVADEALAPSVPRELSVFVENLATLGLVDRCAPPLAAIESSPATAPAEFRRGSGVIAPWATPRLLWQEEVTRVTNQVSPPQQIGNPACLP